MQSPAEDVAEDEPGLLFPLPEPADAPSTAPLPPPPPAACWSVTEVVNGRKDLQTLQTLMATDAAALKELLDSEELTFFAPSNAAWDSAVVEALDQDQAALEEVRPADT